ncbi:MAG: CHAT domain-containing protein [Chloroflexales bacterium]|nr:CHAT domain-containing protein [Chloroflexales bacterium]
MLVEKLQQLDAEAIVEQLLSHSDALQTLPLPLPNDIAEAVVKQLKSVADRHWFANANRSLEIAELIIHIGQQQNNLSHIALGTMARGDALKYLGCLEAAWEDLEAAGQLFLEAGYEVGWARTRIGKLGIYALGIDSERHRIEETLAEAESARKIFVLYGEYEKVLRLDLNMGAIHHWLGNQQAALNAYQSALSNAKRLREIEHIAETKQDFLGVLYNNLGLVYDVLGDFRSASKYYEDAHTFFTARNELTGIALVERNMARTLMAQGRYQHALQLLHHAHDLQVDEQLPFYTAQIKRHIVECYLHLKRHKEAYELASQVIETIRSFGATREEALLLLYMATAAASLSDLTEAQETFHKAELLFESLGATNWLMTTRLRRGRIALEQGDPARAEYEAIAAAHSFKAFGEQINYATALLLRAQAKYAQGLLEAAKQLGRKSLDIARHCNVPPLRYSSHFLLGQVAESQGDIHQAYRRYRASISTVERVQRGLTITLAPGFLEDKSGALHALIGLHLRLGRTQAAFETLEQAKSQTLLNYVVNREQLRWHNADAHSRNLIAQLNRLREEYQWFYHLARATNHTDEQPKRAIEPQQALAKLADCEQQMRIITDQLYLHSSEQFVTQHITAPSLPEIQARLSGEALLIEFYNDGVQLWAFIVEQHGITVHRLPIDPGHLDRLLAQLQSNLAFALKTSLHSPALRNLTIVAQRILYKIYTALLLPIANYLKGQKRLLIVPYGALHFLPFHLLYTGKNYLIEEFEVIVLPAAGLATRRSLARPRGARALAHSWDGRLPQTRIEAQLVGHLWGGDIHVDHNARRASLEADPVQILHVAAHGEHRLDQPDLSYIQLADGQLWADDLFQSNLSYELVTLSACETGRANVVAGDELIGLGRGFLHAGAGALITSLWQIPDETAVQTVRLFYHLLHQGSSKAAALRYAQQEMLDKTPQLHPAFWGAFQLIGDPSPLSRNV